MRLREQLTSKRIACLSFILYCVWTVIAVLRHEPRGDEYHVWGMVYHMNLSELWSAMSVEGHFIFWHILQWPFVKWLGMDYRCIYIVSLAAMVLAAWLLLFKLDFSTLGKLLILFSAPFCYYFPVVARCYALIPPILVGLAVLYQKKKYPFLYCTLLGLLANTHAYIEGLVAVLWLLFVYNQVYLLWKTNPRQAKKNLWASLVTVAFVVFAFVQVVGGLIAVSRGMEPPGEGKNTAESWLLAFHHGNRIWISDLLHDFIGSVPRMDIIATITAWLFVVVGTYEAVRRSSRNKWQMGLILFVGIAWQMFFACNLYGMQWHRVHLPYFVVVFVLWIAYARCNKRWTNMALLAFWLLNTSSAYTIGKDLLVEVNDGADVAKEYEALITRQAPLYTDFLTGAHDLMDKNFVVVEFDRYDTMATETAVAGLLQETGDCYLLMKVRLKVRHNVFVVDTLATSGREEWGSYLYYISKKENETVIE